MNVLKSFLTKLAFALEKLAALFASQRAIVAVGTTVTICVAAWFIIGPALGFATGETAPDDAAIEVVVAAWMAAVVTLMTSVAAILRVASQLLNSFDTAPPSLVREDYNNLRTYPIILETTEETASVESRWHSTD